MKSYSSIHKEILRLAGPNILSNISVPLLSSVDTYLMGTLSPLHLGAVGLGSMIFNFIYWNFGFLRMGTTGLTAQAVGQSNAQSIFTHLLKGCLLAGLLSIILIVFQNPIIAGASQAMDVQPEQLDMVYTYFQVRIWAAPASLGLYVLMGWFFGLQNAWYPLWVTIVANVCNICVSYLLVIRYDYGIYGVALGTVIAQYVALVVAAALVLWRYKKYLSRPDWKALSMFKGWIDYLLLNRDIFLRTLCLTLVFAFFYRQSSSDNAIILAVNVILLQLVNWMSYGVDGFAYAAESLAGRLYGAQDKKRYDQAIQGIFIWSFVLAALFALVYYIFGAQLLTLFSDGNADVVTVGKVYLIWMIILPIIGTPSYIWDGIFVGLTASKSLRDSMFWSFIIFFFVFFVSRPWGNHGLWLALLSFLAGRGLIQWWMYAKKGWELK